MKFLLFLVSILPLPAAEWYLVNATSMDMHFSLDNVPDKIYIPAHSTERVTWEWAGPTFLRVGDINDYGTHRDYSSTYVSSGDVNYYFAIVQQYRTSDGSMTPIYSFYTRFRPNDTTKHPGSLPINFNAPIIGTVELPSWVKSAEAACFFFGFCFAAGIRIFRAATRWFKRAGTEEHS